MRIPDILKLSTRMFKTRKMRTFLTIMGIGIGIGAILFLVSLGYGLQRALISQITSSDALLSLDVVQGEKAVLTINNDVIAKIREFPQVKEIAPMVSLRGQILYESTTADAVANIASTDFLRFSNLKFSGGDIFDENKNEIIISSAVTRVLSIENPIAIIGKEISLSFLAVRVLENGQEELDLVPQAGTFMVKGVVDDDSSSFLFFPLERATGITLDAYSQLKVRVNQTADLDVIRNKILDMGFSVAALSDVIDQANKIFGILQIILAIFGMVALVVSAIGMFNTESIIMGFLGGVIGIIVGVASGKIFNLILNILARNLGGNAIDIFYTPLWFAVTIIVFSTFVGLLTGVWPARRAAHLNPLEAVKYK